MNNDEYEREDMLRRAFVRDRVDYIEADSRRQQRALQSIALGMEKGWLCEQKLDDGQSTASALG